MSKFDFKTLLTIVLTGLYIVYLCWVLIGGLRNRRIRLKMYLIITLLMIFEVLKNYNGIHSYAEVINVCIILVIAITKGVILGRKKVVEKVDDIWYMHHDRKYIAIWLLFVIKLGTTQLLRLATKVNIPTWNMFLYFCIYYPWRTINIFIANSEMRKDIFSRLKYQIKSNNL
ncbi:MAG: hypothetical protein GX895_02170 [Clostridiales bacterium]|uniref:hypothetical protein n=1 Tax=Clostridium sp. N3C TaxID=1776758 RepID=UPI00092E0E25|nr:hypothetical protein [Clostridium sp. N3C]NLZ47589.1 hypothetical protein [Clostridiales bacterium]SCN25057.1 hypothetical protein N3C_2140 [Clostridium sp. N3C]